MDMRQKLKDYLGEKRYNHSVGVEETAAALAKMLGADENKARTAGLMHDVTKEFEPEIQKTMLKDGGIVLNEAEKSSHKLLHAMTAPMVLEKDFEISDGEILSAVRYHTTGRKDMSVLEKIIYMADFIEPNRDFEGVDELRSLAFRDFDAALILALEMTIEEVKEKGAILHPDTAEALKFLVGEGKKDGKEVQTGRRKV